MINEEIKSLLLSYKDDEYKAFHKKLVPNVNPDTILGVRTPIIRKLAKDLFKREDIADFLHTLPHEYYDENVLHGGIISLLKDYDETVKYLDEFLPYVDNWAVCDLTSPKSFTKNHDKLLSDVFRYIDSDETYTVRFGIITAMSHFLGDDYSPELTEKISKIKSDEYYVNTAVAWYFATALAKRGKDALPYIENRCLSKDVHNKTIRKAVESYRITEEQKTYLKTLKI